MSLRAPDPCEEVERQEALRRLSGALAQLTEEQRLVVISKFGEGLSNAQTAAWLGKTDLQFMREEEKLAHDVYVTLFAKWGLPVFANIVGSEQQHTDAIASLLDKYGLYDPAAGKGIGEFEDAELQELYIELVQQGAMSEVEALKTGALIEDLDIVELGECMSHTERLDILRVYQNLQDGSANHLRAFVGNLEARGETYDPVYLSDAEYDAILAAGSDSGSGRRGNWGGRTARWAAVYGVRFSRPQCNFSG